MNEEIFVNCSLVNISTKNNRISFIFHEPSQGINPMRTVQIKTGGKAKSMFEIYSLAILGKVPDIDSLNAYELINLFKKEAKSKTYLLLIKPSKCGQFTDILKIRRAKLESILSVNN